MFGLFRRHETPPDAAERHTLTLDLIEQVAALRGQVRAVQTEWDDVRLQIKKGFGRMEKAHDRLVKKQEGAVDEPDVPAEPAVELHGFAKKLQEVRG